MNQIESKDDEEKINSDELIIRQPDDFHLHLRDGDSLKVLVPHTISQFGRAIVMPNLIPPVRNVKDAKSYRERIMKYCQTNNNLTNFEPLMTLYLTDNTIPQDIIDASNSGIIFGIKLYPKGATTNSDNGVTDITKLSQTLKTMEKYKIPLLIHGEVTDPNCDVFDRESVFLDNVLPIIIKTCPNLKIVLEHITTAKAVKFVENAGKNIGATITAHHLMSSRNDIFKGGITPHMYCLPIIKTENDRLALVKAAISGSPKYFAGTDSAPHEKQTKECCNGKAGIYTGYSAISLYCQIFDQNNALDKLEKFISENGANFYDLPLNKNKIKLVKKSFQIPKSFEYLGGELIPYKAGQTLDWSIDSIIPFVEKNEL